MPNPFVSALDGSLSTNKGDANIFKLPLFKRSLLIQLSLDECLDEESKLVDESKFKFDWDLESVKSISANDVIE